jgi:hypothetical protein
VNISFEDDVTVILLFGVSFMINDEASSVRSTGMPQLEERLNLHMAQSKKLIQTGDELNENWWQVRHINVETRK